MGKKRKGRRHHIPSSQCAHPLTRGWHVHVDCEWVPTKIEFEEAVPGARWRTSRNGFNYEYELFSATEGRQINTGTRTTRNVKWLEEPEHVLRRSTAEQMIHGEERIPKTRRAFIRANNEENDREELVVMPAASAIDSQEQGATPSTPSASAIDSKPPGFITSWSAEEKKAWILATLTEEELPCSAKLRSVSDRCRCSTAITRAAASYTACNFVWKAASVSRTLG